jgi:hypothetical protein
MENPVSTIPAIQDQPESKYHGKVEPGRISVTLIGVSTSSLSNDPVKALTACFEAQ